MKILMSVPGIGPANASTLLSELPELGIISNKKIAALLGVTPMIRQSGMGKGKVALDF